jgi:predicted nucleic acid-binding protein
VTTVLLDTNVLVSFLTDRNKRQQESAAALFETAAQGRADLVVHQMVLSEMVYVLMNLYDMEPAAVAPILDELLAMPGVQPVDELSWSTVLELWPERIPDFADACLTAVAKLAHVDAIATFDRQFVKRLRKEGIKSYWT